MALAVVLHESPGNAGFRAHAHPRYHGILNKTQLTLPAAAQAQVSAALGFDSPAYRVTSHHGGLHASNPKQRLLANFTGATLYVSSGSTRVGLKLRAIGYGTSLTPQFDSSIAHARANRVVYSYPGITGWYANGPMGIEQGFTVAKPPSTPSAGALTLSMALSGDSPAAISNHGHSLMLNHKGGPSLRYGDLSAIDASGRPLPSWLELRPRQILIRVDTRGARYPLRIDPLLQQGDKLTGGESAGANFGDSVALSADGNTALVGGYFDNSEVGGAWVFTRSGTTWTQQGPKLTGSEEEGRFGARFGFSVALSADGNTALIGGPHDNQTGSAWVFTRSGTTWTQQGKKLTAGGEYGQQFGWSVSLSGDGSTALISGGDPYNFGLGAAWIFKRSGETWTQEGGPLKGSGETAYSNFGLSVALSSDGNTALVGGPGDSGELGAAWVFTKSGEIWSQQGPKLTYTEGVGPYVYFGDRVALSSNGDTALIGGPTDNHFAGAAWVFTRSGETWSQQGPKLTYRGGIPPYVSFGSSVALSSSGNVALVGAPGDNGNRGAAWVFTRSGSTWSQQEEKLTGTGEVSSETFPGSGKYTEAGLGTSVALSLDGETALIGGPEDGGGGGGVWAFAFGPAIPPTLTTTAASSIDQTSATLNGTVNPNQLTVSDCHFEYGISEAYGSSMQCSSRPGSGTSPTVASASIGGLSADTTYHFRLSATSPGGTGYSEDQILETLPNAPTVTTAHASAVEHTSVGLEATVDPEGGEVSNCHFEYGASPSYGGSVPCAHLPGSGTSPVAVSASIVGLGENTTYYFRVVATNPGGTSYGANEKITTTGPPDFGRCVAVPVEKEGTKTVYRGGFTKATCLEASHTRTGKYEWYPGATHAQFTTSLKTGVASIETVVGLKVVCSAESGSGEYSGIKEVADLVLKFSGCESFGRRCTTVGLAQGEIATKALEGSLGWEAKATSKVALDLNPVSKSGVVMEYRCIAQVPVTIEGSVVVPTNVNGMALTSPMEYSSSKGRQKPEMLEGGPIDVLKENLNGEASELSGLTAKLTRTNQEAIEINTIF